MNNWEEKFTHFEFFCDCHYCYDLHWAVFNEKKISFKTGSFCENEAIYFLSSIKDNVFSFLKMYLTMEIFYKEFCIQTVLFWKNAFMRIKENW